MEKLDTDTLIWAIRNAGGNRISVVNHILRLGFSVLSDRDARRLGNVLREVRDEAKFESNGEKMQFFEQVRTSQTLREMPNLHI